eukprot:353751-Chlamydomonas_euryale.AAC.1
MKRVAVHAGRMRTAHLAQVFELGIRELGLAVIVVRAHSLQEFLRHADGRARHACMRHSRGSGGWAQAVHVREAMRAQAVHVREAMRAQAVVRQA